MDKPLKCFISSSYESDTSLLRNVLAEYGIDSFDIYDFSIGESLQQILKRKIKESNFCVFIISGKSIDNVIYEMGVCEGMGKEYFVLVEDNLKIPLYLKDNFFMKININDRKDVSLVVNNIDGLYKRKRANKSSGKIIKKVTYSSGVKGSLKEYLAQIRKLRDDNGSPMELEFIMSEVFKILNFEFVENQSNKNRGADFALWNDGLGRVIGNPIIIELKYGTIGQGTIFGAEEQVLYYLRESKAPIGIIIYLDRKGRRYKGSNHFNPLILSFDAEDFVNELLNRTFEELVILERNRIAHGV